MPQVKITLNDDSLAFMGKHPQFSKSDIINAAIAAINRVNDSDSDNRARLGLVMMGAGVVVDAESHLRSLLTAPTPTQALSLPQAPAQTQSVAQSPVQTPAQSPAQPESQTLSIPPSMLDPSITDSDRANWARSGWTPPPGVPVAQLRRLHTQHLLESTRAKFKAEQDGRAEAEAERARMEVYNRRGMRPHDIVAAETLREVANAVHPVMTAVLNGDPPAEPGPLPEIEPRVYEALGPTGVKYPLTKEEWEAIKDEMTPGMQEAFATRDTWYYAKNTLSPWETMVKAWLDNGDDKGSRAQFIPKQKPNRWSLPETYMVNEPGVNELCPEGWTFSAYCFHGDYYGAKPRFGWVRRFKNQDDDNHIYFSFHDVLRALDVGQFQVWMVDMDLPRGLYDQWHEVSVKLRNNPLPDDAIEHDAYDLDKRYKQFPPELFIVHEGILWLNLRGLYRMKDTVMRVMGEDDYDEFMSWIEESADFRAHARMFPRPDAPEGLKLPN